jgi:hypothetical protein
VTGHRLRAGHAVLLGQPLSAALPLFQKVLNLYNGHPLVKEYLAEAQAKANEPADVPLPADSPAGSPTRPRPSRR